MGPGEAITLGLTCFFLLGGIFWILVSQTGRELAKAAALLAVGVGFLIFGATKYGMEDEAQCKVDELTITIEGVDRCATWSNGEKIMELTNAQA